jgi:hypothetical protein
MLWTLGVLLFLALTVRDGLRSPGTTQAAGRALVRSRFPLHAVSKAAHRQAIAKATDSFAEVFSKIQETPGSESVVEDLHDTVGRAYALLALQYQSAIQAEELWRILDLLDGQSGMDGASPTGLIGKRVDPDDPAALRMMNVRAVRDEMLEAEGVVTEIGQRLATLLLQVTQMRRRTMDLVASAEIRQEAADTLDQLQRAVDARREAAARIVEIVAPGQTISKRAQDDDSQTREGR